MQNVELLHRLYEDWNRVDYEAVLGHLDPEVEWSLPEGGINSGTYRGHAAVREFLENYLDAFDYFRVEPEKFFDADDRVVAFVRMRSRGKGSGVELEVSPAHVWTMRAGKAVRMEVFPGREGALEAVGLS